MNTVVDRQRPVLARRENSADADRELWSRLWPTFEGQNARHLALTNFAGRVYPAVHTEMMSRLLHILPHEQVLDIGGGDAPFGRANVVTDAFPDMNAHRSGRSAQTDAGMQFVQCFAEELPFADHAFDVAYCRMVLEHAIDPAAACREMMRVAQRGFLETPSPLAEYLGGHPTHRWIVWVERLPGHAPTLVFRRKPFRRAPRAYALRGPWFRDAEFQFRWEWQYRNVVCTQLAWEDTFAFRVEEGEDGIDYDDPAQAVEAHLDAAINSLLWGDVPTEVILPDADYAISLCPDSALAHNTRGCALWREHHFEEADAAFAEASRLDPTREAYRHNAHLATVEATSSSPALVTLNEVFGEAPTPDWERCALTATQLNHAARLLLNLPPAPRAVAHPVYARLGKSGEEEKKRRREEEKTEETASQNPEHLNTRTPEHPTSAACCLLPAASSFPLTWHAPLRDPSGYADEARHFLFALAASGMEVAARPIRWSEKVAVLPAERARLLQEMIRRPAPPGAIQVCHILAPLFQRDPQARANVGRTMFETDRLPTGWAEACNQMDAVWVPGAFNVETFANAGVQREKLRVVPGAIDLRPYDPHCAPLRIDGARGFNFLAVFDWTLRKGWDILIRAFVEEFRAEEDVALLLKTHSSLGYTGPQLLDVIASYLKETLGRDPNHVPDIILQDTNVPDARMPHLYRAADCYVMPSRGEGWGRPYMEAMAMGLPVIAPGWSGQTAFMNADNSYVLDYEIVDVPEPAWRETPTYQGHRWAEPSCSHLRQLLRRAFEDRAEGRRLGEAARAHLATHFTYAPVAAILAAEIERVGFRIQDSGSGAMLCDR